MTLRVQSSGAQATVTKSRLISDNVGTLIGSFFVPDSTIAENPQFTAGNKSLRFTASPVNSLIPGTIFQIMTMFKEMRRLLQLL